jgi:hypothetical protein
MSRNKAAKQFRLPPELAEELAARATAEDRTETAIVVRAIRRELGDPSAGTVGEVARAAPRRSSRSKRAA